MAILVGIAKEKPQVVSGLENETILIRLLDLHAMCAARVSYYLCSPPAPQASDISQSITSPGVRRRAFYSR